MWILSRSSNKKNAFSVDVSLMHFSSSHLIASFDFHFELIFRIDEIFSKFILSPTQTTLIHLRLIESNFLIVKTKKNWKKVNFFISNNAIITFCGKWLRRLLWINNYFGSANVQVSLMLTHLYDSVTATGHAMEGQKCDCNLTFADTKQFPVKTSFRIS